MGRNKPARVLCRAIRIWDMAQPSECRTLAPLDIIERWIAHAEAHRLRKHGAEFWTVRDILEDVVRVPPWRREQAIEFVKTCKASAGRDEILKAMEAMEAKR